MSCAIRPILVCCFAAAAWAIDSGDELSDRLRSAEAAESRWQAAQRATIDRVRREGSGSPEAWGAIIDRLQQSHRAVRKAWSAAYSVAEQQGGEAAADEVRRREEAAEREDRQLEASARLALLAHLGSGAGLVRLPQEAFAATDSLAATEAATNERHGKAAAVPHGRQRLREGEKQEVAEKQAEVETKRPAAGNKGIAQRQRTDGAAGANEEKTSSSVEDNSKVRAGKEPASAKPETEEEDKEKREQKEARAEPAEKKENKGTKAAKEDMKVQADVKDNVGEKTEREQKEQKKELVKAEKETKQASVVENDKKEKTNNKDENKDDSEDAEEEKKYEQNEENKDEKKEVKKDAGEATAQEKKENIEEDNQRPQIGEALTYETGSALAPSRKFEAVGRPLTGPSIVGGRGRTSLPWLVLAAATMPGLLLGASALGFEALGAASRRWERLRGDWLGGYAPVDGTAPPSGDVECGVASATGLYIAIE